MELIRRGERIFSENYGLVFEQKGQEGRGFSFACDKEGKPLQEKHPIAQENLEKCLRGEDNVIPKGVQTYYHSYFQPAQGRCDCGMIMDLPDFTNVCEGCGSYYNSCAQPLVPENQWEEPWDED